MQPQLLLQALFIALAASAPLPQRTSGLPDLSGLIGSGGLSGNPLSGGSLGGGSSNPPSFPGLGSGSSFNLTRLTSLFSGANSGSGTSFDLSKWRELLGGGLGSGGGTTPTVPSIPSIPGGSTGGGSGSIGGGGFSFGGSSTASDITSKKACKSNILLFARGTTEGGNVGSSVGPSLIKEIEKAAPGKFLFQGVDYAADIAGITGLGRAGGEIAVKQFGEATALCPGARVFLSGYSQGAMVMHNAVKSTSVDKAKIGVSTVFLVSLFSAPLSRRVTKEKGERLIDSRASSPSATHSRNKPSLASTRLKSRSSARRVIRCALARSRSRRLI